MMKLSILTLSIAIGISVLVPATLVYTQNASFGKETLVLIDTEDVKATHSLYFKSLTDAGYKLTFKLADDASLSLKKYGVWTYQHLIIFAPATEEFGGDLSPDAIAEFVDNGGNVLVGSSPQAGDAIRDLAAEFGMEMDDPGTYVIDHHHVAKGLDSGKHIAISVEPTHLIDALPIVGSKNIGPILYEGANLLVDPENPLVLEILTGSSTSYAYDPTKQVADQPHAIGSNCVLIAGLQARNNARVIFSGSLELFSDAFLTTSTTPKSGNSDLIRSLSAWVFKERGVLRLSNVTHHKVGESEAPASYTITEDLVYSVMIEELQRDGSGWGPYNAKDIQLEFVRIDPFVRTNLKHLGGGKYEARFKVPDVYGVFQFKIDYQRKGYTFLSSATQVSVRPLQHTQYERFIPSAYPYYASAFSMMFGVVVFSFVFLHFKEKDKSE